MSTAVLVGSTGLVGSHILSILLEHPSFTSVSAYTRKPFPTPSSKLHPLQSDDSSSWPSQFPNSPIPSIFLSALGTTRAAAGGLANQRKIDYDLNLELARAAKDAGVQTYVLISSAGATAKGLVPYTKMKGELEDAVKTLGFKHCVILKPGLLVGERKESRPTEWLIRQLAKGAGAVGNRLKDFWAQDAEVVARAAVSAGLSCIEGKQEEGVWVLEQNGVVRLGRTEWDETKNREES